MSKELPSPLLIKEASAFDKQLRSVWAKMKSAIGVIRKASIDFGEIVTKMQAKELHKYVPKENSRKGYISFEEYIERLTGGELSKNMLYLSKQMYELTQGPHALPAATVAEMPQENVRLMSSLEPEQRTPEVLKAVRKPNREFVKIVQGIKNENLPAEQQETPRVEFYREWHPDVVTKLEATMKRFHNLNGIVADGDYELTLDEKAVMAICWAAETQCSDLLTAAEARLQDEALDIPETKEAAPEKSEAPETQPVKKNVAPKKAKRATPAEPESSGRLKHALGCRCLMCRPLGDKAVKGRAAAAIQ